MVWPPAPTAWKTSTSKPSASMSARAASTHFVVLPNIDAVMSGASSPSGTCASTMPQTAAAARVKTPRLMRLRPLMSTMAGIIMMSLTPTKPRTSPLASVDTITFGMPSGNARIAAVPIGRSGAAAHRDDGVDAAVR